MANKVQMKPLITAKNLRKVFGSGDNQVKALRGVSLTVHAGEMVAIMGPSGCGKTTLLHQLSGIDQLTGGSVWFEGTDLYDIKEKRRDRIRAEKMGFVFQSYNLIPVLNAVENVELPLLSMGVSTKEARKKATESLARVGLKERGKHLPWELSGGQQQRVAIARAIVNRPDILWADEPTGALDRKTTEMILDLIEHLKCAEGISVVIVTHDPKVAERADRILYMDSGRLVQQRIPSQNINSFLCGEEER